MSCTCPVVFCLGETAVTKTLYISDLDGTLLHSDERISKKSCKIINDLVEKGMLFSYATARSSVTAQAATAGLKGRIPTIVYNGVFVQQRDTGERLLSHLFSPVQAEEIWGLLRSYHISPIVYSLIDAQEKFSYQKSRITPGMACYLDSRRGDYRNRPLTDETGLIDGQVFYFTCIDEEERLFPLYEQLKQQYYCVYQRDIYSGAQWLEILPSGASKANALAQLRGLLGVDRVVSFGDSKNDLPMFAVSDECYAVENASQELKAAATGIIPGNNEDGVACWLLERFERGLL